MITKKQNQGCGKDYAGTGVLCGEQSLDLHHRNLCSECETKKQNNTKEEKPLKEKVKIQKCWIWNDTITNFVRKRLKGHSLNVCAGMNELGSVKVDLDPKDKSIIKAEMSNLPFKDNTFDSVVSDPPWKIGFYQRMRPFFECVRVCKIGGTIIYNAYWIPTSKEVKLKQLWVRTDTDWANTSIISVFEKVGRF